MLSHQENEKLTRVGLDTPIGGLFRRFWVPVMLASELPAPDCPPVRLQYLGKTLVAFRDTSGRVGVLDAYCPHRRANLYWGRNEHDGLRCAYHGWKFDIDGKCVDMPNCPEGPRYKEKISTLAFAAQEAGGLIWVYGGPREEAPPLPDMGWMRVPDSHRYVAKVFMRCNWLQAMEGDVDSSHVSFLHSTAGSGFPGNRVDSHAFFDRAPRYVVKDTASGLRLAAQRQTEDGQSHWRVSHWLMPCFVMVASPVGTPHLFNARVPIDDLNTLFIRLMWHPERPLTASETYEYQHAGVFFPELIPGTFLPAENMENEYRIDRAAQRTRSWTGIKSVPAQDWAVVEDQGGPLLDRSLEHLCSTDLAITSVRRRLLKSLKALDEGHEPSEPSSPDAYDLRPVDIVLPNDVDLEVGARKYVVAGAGRSNNG